MHLPTRSDLTSWPSRLLLPKGPIKSNRGVFRRNSSRIAADILGGCLSKRIGKGG